MDSSLLKRLLTQWQQKSVAQLRYESMTQREKVKHWLKYSVIVTLLCLVSVTVFDKHYLLAKNRSGSLPGHLYIVERTGEVPHKGELIAFSPGPTPVYQMSVPFLKMLGGVPGDIVTEIDRVYYVNGRPLAVSQDKTAFGTTLKKGPTGVIPDGRYFVYTPDPNGYDSRYDDIGWVSIDSVIGPGHLVMQ